MTVYQRLSSLDTSFLHLESIETPMHVGTLVTFEGAPFFDASGRFRLAEVRALVASRLHQIPKFRQRLMSVPMEQGRPVWVDDDRFDISYHVRLTALARPGSWSQLLELTARVQAQLLDRSRPLWELWFVEGLEDGSVGLLHKTHHAMTDGVSGVDVATVLLDITPGFVVEPAPPWTAEPAPSSSRLLADTLVERSTEPSEIARTMRGLVRAPHRAVEKTGRVGQGIRSLFDRSPIAPRTSLNVEVGRRRRFVGVPIPLPEVQAIRARSGGTVNDVVLAIVSGALRRRFTDRGDDLPEHVRVLCPVSVRDPGSDIELGNQISALFVDLPIAEPDAETRLREISSCTRALKDREQAVGASFLLDLTHFAAPTILGLAARAIHRQPFVNLVVTNVPGPPVPLYCLGGRMNAAYPLVPLTHNLSLGIAILSYCDTLHFGLYADADANPDLDELGDDLRTALAELRHADQPVAVTKGAVG